MKKIVIRDNSRIENVDFTKLDKILNKKGIRRAELSRRCGYYSYYVKDHVFKEKKLALASINKHISIEDFIFDCILEGLKQEEN